MHQPLKRFQTYRGKDIRITSGSARELPPGSFAVLAIGGGAEGWGLAHIGPDGDAADLGGEYYFATAEEALDFLHQLIDLMLDGGEPEAG